MWLRDMLVDMYHLSPWYIIRALIHRVLSSLSDLGISHAWSGEHRLRVRKSIAVHHSYPEL